MGTTGVDASLSMATTGVDPVYGIIAPIYEIIAESKMPPVEVAPVKIVHEEVL